MTIKERDFCLTDFMQYVTSSATRRRGAARGGGRMAMAIYRTKTWVPRRKGGKVRIKIGFLDGSKWKKQKVKKISHQWEKVCSNIKFIWRKPADSDVRISFAARDDWWSRIGTDAKLTTDKRKPTMNLGYRSKTGARMFRRHILHEFGHMLGAVHDQSSPGFPYRWDRRAVKRYYQRQFKNQHPTWTTAQINNKVDSWTKTNIFPRYTKKQVNASPFDSTSIMQYPIPANWMTTPSGKKVPAIPENYRLSNTDKEWMRKTYCPNQPNPDPNPEPIPQPIPQPYVPPRPYQFPATDNLCGNPSCGQTFICTADYNRRVQGMGYPGVTSGGGGGGVAGGWAGWYGCYRRC